MSSKPYFGIEAAIVDDSGTILEGECEGKRCMLDSWPGQMRTVYGDHQRFIDTYFSQFKGKYFTGDGCRRDKDGFYWITGRVDDCINVSCLLLGTAEIESAFVEHELVSGAAVVGYPHGGNLLLLLQRLVRAQQMHFQSQLFQVRDRIH